MKTLLKFFSLDNIIGALVDNHGYGTLFAAIVAKFGLADLIDMAVAYAKPLYAKGGADAVARLVTIPEAQARLSAGAMHADEDAVVSAWRAFGQAFAALVASYFPKAK